MVGDHAQMIEMAGYNDIFVRQYRVATFDEADDVFSRGIRVIGGVHLDMRFFPGMEGGGFPGLVDFADGLGIRPAGTPEDIVYHRVGHVAIDEAGIIRSVRPRYPFIKQADSPVFYGVVQLGLMEGMVVP